MTVCCCWSCAADWFRMYCFKVLRCSKRYAVSSRVTARPLYNIGCVGMKCSQSVCITATAEATAPPICDDSAPSMLQQSDSSV
jgi:hypothetical protein